MSDRLVIRHWVATTPDVVWHAYTTPEVVGAFRSSYRKLGRVLDIDTQERPCGVEPGE